MYAALVVGCMVIDQEFCDRMMQVYLVTHVAKCTNFPVLSFDDKNSNKMVDGVELLQVIIRRCFYK